MHYANIKYCDIANGEGIRTSIFVSGCRHHCPECFNREAWDFNYGKPFTDDVLSEILDSLAPDYITGLTVLGGEPMDLDNQAMVAHMMAAVRERYPQKDIWCYTGYRYEADLLPGGRAHGPVTEQILGLIDVLVDGPFIKAQADISLRFKGSTNQRIIEFKDGQALGLGA